MDSPPEKVSSQEEIEVKEGYILYNPDKSGEVHWLQLKIYTRKNQHQDKKQLLCGICQKDVKKLEESEMDCNHVYHDECR